LSPDGQTLTLRGYIGISLSAGRDMARLPDSTIARSIRHRGKNISQRMPPR